MPELVTEWGDHKLWPAQITAIRNLERSFAANKPRALIQMATGSGKTFTAISFIYRLIKYAGARAEAVGVALHYVIRRRRSPRRPRCRSRESAEDMERFQAVNQDAPQ
ncbi:MAG: DEAD/DEAH box helicase family protein [Betaproteobacteria bacterium]|nr:DEAD/DEAH box helicase family protein [Betaproteobacteria bacterium]MDE2208605.1 DEAD/DEAH box helicase family protein [Betaproteobacteria bacterium]MDE2360585.1 DEAD/DEAH box helicase family protein [Betaproteobacteria bacterium]